MSDRLSAYSFERIIGKGNFAEVWLAVERSNYTMWAIKILNEDQIKSNPKVLELLKSEIKILKGVDSPNVVKLKEDFFEKNKYHLVMEYCQDGDLEKYIKTKPGKCISEIEALGYLKQLLNGFKALHEIKAMHRDFKLANVLINEGILKIADLGFSKQADLARTALGTGVYMAPEIMKYEKYNNKVDIWSLGISLYEMLFGVGVFPFYGADDRALLKNVQENKINFNAGGKKISPQTESLIKQMLIVDPAKRIDWIEIYNHNLLNIQPAQGNELLKSVGIYMKSGDMEKQHQQVVFQNNKDFYKVGKNLEYDNEELMKRLEYHGENDKKEKSLQKEKKNDKNLKEMKKENSIEEEKTSEKERSVEKKLLKENLEKLLLKKKEALVLLENKYLHWRNIIGEHAKVLGDGYRLITNDNAIFIYFILAKRIMFLAKELFNNLECGLNYFEDSYFEDFKMSHAFQKIRGVFKDEKAIYEAYFESLLVDIKGYNAFSNPLYIKLKEEFNEKIQNVENLFKEILLDYLFNGQLVVSSYSNENKKAKAKDFVLHLIELSDCYRFRDVFIFNANEEAGFDFDRYQKELIEIPLEKLQIILDGKIVGLLG